MDGIEVFLSVFSSSFVGAIAKDLHDVINGKSSNFRVFSIILACITSFFIVAFGVFSLLPEAEWKLLSFVAFVLSFSSVKIASIFTKNLSFLSNIPLLKDIGESLKENDDNERKKRK